MASFDPRSPGRLKMLAESLRKSPRVLGQKLLHRSRSLRTPKSHRREVIPQTNLDDVSLGAYSKYAPAAPRVVVAIDFGTTYSGYAYAFTHSPEEIHFMHRSDGHLGGMATKMPTILLLNDRGGFHSFGYAAREAYHDLEEAETKKWLYFEKFKMELHSRQELHRDMELEAASGRSVLASLVFAHALRYFKDCCLKELNGQSTLATPLSPNDIRWVITVPAIWRQSAKQFMRHAATQAELVTADTPKRLIIALEPEAASIYCRKLRLRECFADPYPSLSLSASPSPSTGAPKYNPLSSAISSHSLTSDRGQPSDAAVEFGCGMRYVVADCGGGTVDLTVHELDEGGRLKELYKATGGAWGSIGVDCQFETLLVDIFGEKFVVDFVRNKPVSWMELMSQFEARKRSFSPGKHTAVNISLPFAFVEHYHKRSGGQTVEDAIRKCGDDGIQWSSQGMLRLQPAVMMSLFDPVISEIIHHIQELLLIPELQRIEYLFLVGGFSESPVLQEAVRDTFRTTLRVVIPHSVSLTILKGAVMFGIDPTLVHVRRSMLTYGVGCLNKFVPGKHPPEKRTIKEGMEWCTDVFDTFVFADQAVSYGQTVTRSYTPAQADQQSTIISLFASESDSVQFVTDTGVNKVAQLLLEMPDTTGGRCRELQMTMSFADTEIHVEAVDCTSGQVAHASLDFLSK